MYCPTLRLRRARPIEANLRSVGWIRRLYRPAKCIARARDRRHAGDLMDRGAQSQREMLLSSLQVGEDVLVALGVPAAVARDHGRRFLAHDERLLNAQYLVHDDAEALMQASSDARRELEQLFDADQGAGVLGGINRRKRSEEHTSELQSLMRTAYAA